MSAPAPGPAPATLADSLTRRNLLRLLGMAALVGGGFVAIWQGFGAAGYGTDTHPHRVLWVCIQLTGFALVLVCVRGWLLVRLLVALAFFASAGHVWWGVRTEGATGRSLAAAVAERDRYRELIATAKLDDIEQHQGLRGLDSLIEEYPSLTAGMAENYDRWKAGLTDDIVARYGGTTPDDFKTVATLREWTKLLTEVRPQDKKRLDEAFRQWLLKARSARDTELSAVPLGDWAGFDRTAPGRKALADAFGGIRALLVTAEEEWAKRSVEALADRAAEPRHPRLSAIEKDVLALKSLNTDDSRFIAVRQQLFARAHETVQREVTAHLDAGRYDLAFGAARRHAVEWSATAAILGPDEVKKLDKLREHCGSFAQLYEVSAKPADPADIAPPPRTKPEK